jgi:photosystem II stability/assembly factor-like uncharacterized protein
MKPFFASVLLLASVAASTQWETVLAPSQASFRGLSLVNNQVLWLSGTGGSVIRTIDGGRTWKVINVPGAEKLDFRGIHAFDRTTAVVISSGPAESGQAIIYRTENGGLQWRKVLEEKTPGIFFDAVAFWDRNHGIVLSDPVNGKFVVFLTQDGGKSWKQVPPGRLPPSLKGEGAFAASNSCLAVQGRTHVWFATGGASIARVFRSTDRGQTWVVSDTPMHPQNASSGIFSLLFHDSRSGIAVGGDYAHPGNSQLPNTLVTTDGGVVWRPAQPTNPPGLYLSSVAYIPGNPATILAAGTEGLFINSGTGWEKASGEVLNVIKYGKDAAWAAGPKGIILRSLGVNGVGKRLPVSASPAGR